jgi:hypothetical protein
LTPARETHPNITDARCLVYCELIDIRVGKAAVFEIGRNVFDIKLTIEDEKGCPMGHVFIE